VPQSIQVACSSSANRAKPLSAIHTVDYVYYFRA